MCTYGHNYNEACRDIGVKEIIAQSSFQHENNFEAGKVS